MVPPDFQKFLERYEIAAKEWMHGNPKAWSEICSHKDDITIFEAWGGSEKGWAPTGKRYESEASQNKSGRITFENKNRYVTPELAFTVDIVRGHIRKEGTADEMPFELRVTAIFRSENGSWKLVHRHADPLVRMKQ